VIVVLGVGCVGFVGAVVGLCGGGSGCGGGVGGWVDVGVEVWCGGEGGWWWWGGGVGCVVGWGGCCEWVGWRRVGGVSGGGWRSEWRCRKV